MQHEEACEYTSPQFERRRAAVSGRVLIGRRVSAGRSAAAAATGSAAGVETGRRAGVGSVKAAAAGTNDEVAAESVAAAERGGAATETTTSSESLCPVSVDFLFTQEVMSHCVV